MSYCEDDYNKLVIMGNRMISFDNINELIKNIQLTSPEQLERLTGEIKNFASNINPKVLKHLSDIAAVNDPMLNNIKNNINESAYNETVKAIDKQEETSEY